MVELIIKSKTYGEKVCYYDECDDDIVKKYIWCIVPNRKTFYAMSRIKIGYKKYKTIRMHQLICYKGDGFIDHIDRNGLNNTRKNLRRATTEQNNYNVAPTTRNTSGYKGVYPYRNKFVACIRKSGKLIHGGSFKTAELAALKYNELALKHFGEFAYLNKV